MNEIKVQYNPYNFDEVSFDFSDSDNWSTTGTFEDQTGWYVNANIEYEGWTYSDIDMGSAIKEGSTDTPYFFNVLSDSDETLSYTFSHTDITQDSNIQLKISLNAYIQTKEDGLDIYTSGDTYPIQQVQIPISVMVGDQYWKGGNIWGTGATGNYLQPLYVRQ